MGKSPSRGGVRHRLLLIIAVLAVAVGGVVVLAVVGRLPSFTSAGGFDRIIVRVDCERCEAGPDGHAWAGVVRDNHQSLQVRGNSSASYRFERGDTQFWSVIAAIRKEGPAGELRVTFLTLDERALRSDTTAQTGALINITWPVAGDVYRLGRQTH